MSADDITLVDSYDKEDGSAHDDIIRSLTVDFPESIKKFGDISKQSVRRINSLLYDQTHKESHECYIECLQRFVNNPSFYDEKSIHETIEACLSDVESLCKRMQVIIELLDSNNTAEISKEDNPRDTAIHLENRLSAIVDRAKLIQFTELEVERLKESVEQFNQDLSSSTKSVEKIKNDLAEANKDMIAVMGIFTSIIVVIMSLVITSSSWLNNAAGASAIIAFVIPSCVAVLAVCALTALLNLLIKEKKLMPWLLVAFFTLAIGCVTMWQFGNKEVLSHNRLVFEVDKYASADPSNVTGERIINIHFTEKIITSDGEHEVEVVIDNQKETDCLIHNDLIYYCITHNRFE